MAMAHLGTSIYRPRSPFTCDGGPHYPFDPFERIKTTRFAPNTLFMFVKSDISFHGVEPISDPGVERDLLLYSIRIRDAA